MKKVTTPRQKVALLPRQKSVLAEKLFGQVIPDGVIVRENPRTIVHRHTYGGLSRFFEELAKGKLFGTICPTVTGVCQHIGTWLPPRVHCPDCWEEMYWLEIDTSEAKVYTHSMTNLPGAGFMLSTPCPLISVEIPGVCTKFMSYLSEFGEGEPYIGMPIKPVFRTRRPTYTILDVSWVPRE
ncbi:MAG: hypothetical protein Q7S52_02730 [bacterium]|nr:hypothetical protein [bacterium]